MIFHIPIKIDINLHSGSQIRPQKMIQAFKNIGYRVDLIMGYCKERKKQIKEIKNNIKNGVKYNFLYSESSTMPTALTEKHHFPVCPFLDFKFFKFCQQNDIKTGLFYRDIHWKFDFYKTNVFFLKRKFAELFYKLDLTQYKKYLDILYLQSINMYDYIPFNFTNTIKLLPPGTEQIEIKRNDIEDNKTVNFIYVGGLGKLYDLTLFSKTLNEIDNVSFDLCTRKKEWDLNKKFYNKFEKSNVHHKTGSELKNLFEKSQIAVLYVQPIEYWKFALAIKLFEYISHKKPIIAVKETAVGKFIEDNDIGWVIEYNEKALFNLIKHIQSNKSEIEEKVKNIEKIIPQNTWEVRCQQVEKDLSI